ncbi:MAG: transposase zinc-binding domain-containing protein [Chloroflexi bacterium]|nr:transposase zinc-binding domain-containing protein [Chloroflexota bacterium]
MQCNPAALKEYFHVTHLHLDLETWLAHRRTGGLDIGADLTVSPVPAYIERDLRKFLERGILAHGFARACCEKCDQGFLVACSCKGRGVCGSCNTRRIVKPAAHMVEHVFPTVAVRQWVVVFPKRVRYLLNIDAGCLKRVARSGVVQALAGCGGSCGLPMLFYGSCAISAW